MLIRCKGCPSVLNKTNDESNFAFGWYKDELGNHTGFVCTNCGTIHDCVGSLNTISNLFGGQSFKVIRYFTLEKMKKLIYQEAEKIGTGTLSEAAILNVTFGVPIDVVQKMSDKGFVDIWTNI